MKSIKLLCVAIFGIVVGSDVFNAYACNDSSLDDLDLFKICAVHNQHMPSPQKDDKNDMSAYINILRQELTIKRDEEAYQLELFEQLREKIQFLPTGIALKTLQDDYSEGSIEKESLEKIIIDDKDANFVEKLKKQLLRILRNPVGRAIIRCIISCETGEKIVFVPIAGFFDKKTQTQIPPALSVIDGSKYITVTVPTNMEIGSTSLIGITKSKTPVPTIITSLPFHSALAHELIHCIHRMHEKTLYINSKTRSSAISEVFAYVTQTDEEVLDFDMSEELYTVLGIRASDNIIQDEIYREVRFGNWKEYMNRSKLTACGISELMYDTFDKEIDCARVLYYNKRSGVDISKFVAVVSVVQAVFSLLDVDVCNLAKAVYGFDLQGRK